LAQDFAERISKLEEAAIKQVLGYSEQQIRAEYKNIIAGPEAYIGSLRGGVHRICNLEMHEKQLPELFHHIAYTNAYNTYLYTKDAIRDGVKDLKVKKGRRHSVRLSVEEIFSDAVKRMAVLEEYKKNYYAGH
jgi:hypothetical protein